MLTLKLINEETERVIRGLEKKHFPNAKEAIDNVLAVDKKRREAQQELDKSLNEQKQLSGQIGRLMKEGKKDEAEQVKAQVAALKEKSKEMDEQMAKAQEEMTTLLCQIPNIPYDEVPEGKAAEDNHVVKSNLKECTDADTVGKMLHVITDYERIGDHAENVADAAKQRQKTGATLSKVALKELGEMMDMIC